MMIKIVPALWVSPTC